MTDKSSPMPLGPRRAEPHAYLVSVFTPPDDCSEPRKLNTKRTRQLHTLLRNNGLDVDPAIRAPGRGGGALLPEVTWVFANIVWPLAQMLMSAVIAHWVESIWQKNRKERYARLDLASIDITLGPNGDLRQLLGVLGKNSQAISGIVKGREFDYMIQATAENQPGCYLSIDSDVRLPKRLIDKYVHALEAAHAKQTTYLTQADLIRTKTRFGIPLQVLRVNVPKRAFGQDAVNQPE